MALKNHDPFDLVQLYEFISASKTKCGHTRVDLFEKRHAQNERKWGPGESTPLGEPVYRWEAEELEAANRCDTDYSGEFDFGDSGSSTLGEVLKAIGIGVAAAGAVVGVAALIDAALSPERQD